MKPSIEADSLTLGARGGSELSKSARAPAALVTHLPAAASLGIGSIWDRTRGRSSAQFNSLKMDLLHIRQARDLFLNNQISLTHIHILICHTNTGTGTRL